MNKTGLTSAEVEESRRKNGSNMLTQIPPDPLWKKILEGFTDPMIIILLVALVIELILWLCGKADWYEPVGIFVAIIIANGVASVSEKTKQTYYNVFYNFIEARNNDEKTNKLNQATFSSELVSKLLNLYAGENFIVYDPFIGTGTTAVGCVKSEKPINYIGSEISEEQVKYSIERIEKITNVKTCETIIE